MEYPLTEYLAPLFADDPLVLVDIGARWGVDKRWAALGSSLKAYCFEADAAECSRLNALEHSGATFIPEAIAGKNGQATLYKTKFDESTGLYRTNADFFNRLLNADNAALVGTVEVQTLTLDSAREKHAIPTPDFIKLDVEGAELEILQASVIGGTFGVYSEFRFHREINGCPIFSELDQFMRNRRFMLYDIWIGKQSRKVLPYTGPKLSTKDGRRLYAGTYGGQVMDGNALYFRDPMMLVNLTRNQILKAACMFEVFDMNDCAAELLIEREKEAEIDAVKCLDLLAGGSFKQYLENY